MRKLLSIDDNVCSTGTTGGKRKGAGRKRIGTTRKISLTLPQKSGKK